ncbi:MAG: HAMP domain-containing protein [Chthoniobacterales bacterium]
MVYQSPALDAQALVDRNDELHTRKIGDGSLRVGTFRENGWTLRVAADMAEINHLGLDIVLGMFAAIPTVLIVVTLGGRWVARQALGPVERIRKAASAITIHNLTQRLPMPEAEDEIAGLVTVLNATLDRLQSSFEQSVRFSADASHN